MTSLNSCFADHLSWTWLGAPIFPFFSSIFTYLLRFANAFGHRVDTEHVAIT